jgi:hypothetical protein
MEALRNYIQHRSLPVNRINRSRRLVETKDSDFCKLTVSLVIDVKYLAQDKKFKRSVLEELKARACDQPVELIPLIRQYIESMGKVHLKFREILRTDIEQWQNDIYRAIELYKNSTKQEMDFIQARAFSEDSLQIHELEEFDIFDDCIKRRQMFENRNKYFSFSSQYVSSEAPEIKK